MASLENSSTPRASSKTRGTPDENNCFKWLFPSINTVNISSDLKCDEVILSKLEGYNYYSAPKKRLPTWSGKKFRCWQNNWPWSLTSRLNQQNDAQGYLQDPPLFYQSKELWNDKNRPTGVLGIYRYRPGLNFINDLWVAFTCADLESVKKDSQVVSLFCTFLICSCKSCS